jgi:hypothetical protein
MFIDAPMLLEVEAGGHIRGIFKGLTVRLCLLFFDLLQGVKHQITGLLVFVPVSYLTLSVSYNK